ncbi:wax ester synthase/diacylglycerol acyltransferase 3-like [Wolffia australiana]
MAYDEPVSPRGWLFLQPELPHVIHCNISFQDPIDVPALKVFLSSGFVKNFPRLRSLVVTDEKGEARWKELPSIDIDKHVITVPEDGEDEVGKRTDDDKVKEEEENEAWIDQFVNSLVLTSTMRRDIPLWDVHVLPRRRRSLVLRLHHTLGDCLSLIAPLFASFDSVETPSAVSEIREMKKPTMEKISVATGLGQMTRRAWKSVKAAWYTIPYAAVVPLYLMRLKEDKTIIAGETKAVGMPRNLTSLTLSLEDMKTVKKKVNGTINDVFVGITICGVAKYFNLISNDVEFLTAMNFASLREEGFKDLVESVREGKEIEWGNNIGHFLLGIDLKEEDTDPLNYVLKAKEMLDRKKMSFEGYVTHRSGEVMKSILGPQVYVDLACNLLRGVSLLFSNVNGPAHPMAMGKNQITRVGFTANGLHVPIDVRVMSYNGKAFVKLLTATKLIHDPKLLCKCIKDSLHVMMTR